MRLALITDGIWPYVLGGMQKHSYYLCKYLARQKVHIDLYHFNQSDYDISKLEFFSEEERKYITSHVVTFPKGLAFPGHYLFKSYHYSKKIFNLIESDLKDFDFIYVKGFAGWYLINQKYKKKIVCPTIGVKFHGYEMFQTAPNFKIKLQHLFLLRSPVRNISRRADIVFSYGGKITEIIRSLGVKPERIRELPSGVESSLLVENVRPLHEKIHFLFLGRYERRKGIEELNQAIQAFNHSGLAERAEFNFIGPIPADKKLSEENTNYFGEIRDRSKLNELVRQNDILLCPSWSEGMPNVILEAMAGGLAVVATNVGATNVLVNEQTGWLLPDANPDRLTDVLVEIVDADSNTINKKKEGALLLVQSHFTWEHLISKFMRMISKN